MARSRYSGALANERCRYNVLSVSPFFPSFFFYHHFHFPPSGQAVVTGVVPSCPQYVPSFFIALGVQLSHCSPIFIERCQPTHSHFPLRDHFLCKKKSRRVQYVHSVRIESASLILVGTRTTYQPPGSPGNLLYISVTGAENLQFTVFRLLPYMNINERVSCNVSQIRSYTSKRTPGIYCLRR